jgi:hypothetical protein
MILFISNAKKCGESADGTMFLNIRLHNRIHIGNCIAMDGGCPLFLNQFKEQALNDAYEFKDINFVYPTRKELNKNLNINELHYNKVFGSFKSIVEDEFSALGSKFERVYNNRSPVQTSDIK